MPNVELVYDRDCPNVTQARTNLVRAFVQAKLTPRWSEYLHDDAPAHARGFGSPSILVDGRDVAGVAPGAEGCCRVYVADGGRLAGVPDVSTIAEAPARSEADAPPPIVPPREEHGAPPRSS